MAVDIEPGPELDRAVAEAVGDPFPRAHDWEHMGLSGHEESVFRCKNCGDLDLADQAGGYSEKDPCVKPYSTDLNAAFAAAERVGLFDIRSGAPGRDLSKMHGEPETWCVWAPTANDSDPTYGATPALAICAAILKLKGD